MSQRCHNSITPFVKTLLRGVYLTLVGGSLKMVERCPLLRGPTDWKLRTRSLAAGEADPGDGGAEHHA